MSIKIIETSDGGFKAVGIWTLSIKNLITKPFHVEALAGKQICRFYAQPNPTDLHAKINLILESMCLPIINHDLTNYLKECEKNNNPTKIDLLVNNDRIYYITNLISRQDFNTYPASLSLTYDI